MEPFTLYSLLVAILLVNFLFVLCTLCVERKNPALALSWILALIFLPVVGFVLYLMFGTNATLRKKKRLEDKQAYDRAYAQRAMRTIRSRQNDSARSEDELNREYRELVRLNFNMGHVPYTVDNDLEIFVAAKDKYRSLIRDIEQAKSSVHLLYFIIRNDRIGRTIIDILARKAKAGVQIRVLYDHAGCFATPSETFAPLIESGGEVERFFPICLGNYLRANFRNHRKLAIIDGRVGYLGGMNIGDEYMGLAAANSPWRDTHLRIVGSSVYLLQLRFIEDWHFAVNYRADRMLPPADELFPPLDKTGEAKVQIVSSGPDTEEEEIKWNFLKMIYTAQSYVYMQTPYFVPDESFMDALKIAALSGVRIVIMTPRSTDNYVAQKVTLSYLAELMPYGVEVYIYPGFLHAKMLVADDKTASIGSANLDMRSFALNFEINAFLYGKDNADRCARIFQSDLEVSERLDWEKVRTRGRLERAQESIFRFIAPLL